jgi:hypothetical protein
MNTDRFIEQALESAKCIAQDLDFSLKSLEHVDTLLHKAKTWKKNRKGILVECLGCYVGEVLVRETGGRWRLDEQNAQSLEAHWVEVPGNITANPFVRCRKRIQKGESDGVAAWAKVLVAMQKKAGSQC